MSENYAETRSSPGLFHPGRDGAVLFMDTGKAPGDALPRVGHESRQLAVYYRPAKQNAPSVNQSHINIITFIDAALRRDSDLETHN